MTETPKTKTTLLNWPPSRGPMPEWMEKGRLRRLIHCYLWGTSLYWRLLRIGPIRRWLRSAPGVRLRPPDPDCPKCDGSGDVGDLVCASPCGCTLERSPWDPPTDRFWVD